MLVLSRKAGERIAIGSSITLVILETFSGRVRIGIEAPRSISVRRSELIDREHEFGDSASPADFAELELATASH